MQKTLDLKLTGSEASRIAAAIDKCDASLREIFRQMKKDQTKIVKLRTQTRARLAALKNF